MTHKQVIVIRKDLNMRKGKMVAQGAHASLGAILGQCSKTGDILTLVLDERIKNWILGKFTKICVSVNSEIELLELYEQAKGSGIITALIQDAGLTEFGGVPTYTALAIGPDVKEKIDELTSQLPLL